MIQQKKKKCKCGCGREGYIWAKGMLKECYHKQKPIIPIKKTPLKRNYKPTGEGILFDTIIATREHKSFISGIKINNISHSNMAHVLNKKKYPLFRLYEKNIVILHNSYPYLEHHLFDNGTEEQREKYAKEYGADWDKLYNLKEELLNEYNNLKT